MKNPADYSKLSSQELAKKLIKKIGDEEYIGVKSVLDCWPEEFVADRSPIVTKTDWIVLKWHGYSNGTDISEEGKTTIGIFREKEDAVKFFQSYQENPLKGIFTDEMIKMMAKEGIIT
jgi:hypothetical protein